MTEKPEIKKNRRAYTKPRLEQIQLVSEETVLLACKIGNNIGPGGNNCNPGVANCFKQAPS